MGKIFVQRILQFLLFSLVIFSGYSFPTDTLTQSERISIRQTLISSNQIFELGFFSPGNSSKQYVGIWYKYIADKKIVWVANRENPLSASDNASGLMIGTDGNLILIDGMNRTVWSTNVSSDPKNAIVVLLDNGDLILKDNESGLIFWESFNFPGNTFISGMSMGSNNITRESHVLSSWQSEDDPSQGNFVTGLTTENPPQTITWKKSRPYWRSGPWDGSKFLGISNVTFGYSTGLVVTQENKQQSVHITYNSPSLSHVAIIYITVEGNLEWIDWDTETRQGGVTWKSILLPCDVYGTCGPFGVCNQKKPQTCECLKGFIPKSIQEWIKGNWSSGCMRQTDLLCKNSTHTIGSSKREKDGFLKLSLMKLPDLYSYSYSTSFSDCHRLCLSNCSCNAYAYPDGIGCLVWVGDLVDTQQFSSLGADLFLRLAYSEQGQSEKNMKLIISLSTISGVILLGLFLWKAKQRGKEIIHLESPVFPGVNMTQTELINLPMVDFHTLIIATDNFNETNKLGAGGFGPVYKGKLKGGSEIAVKRLASHSGQGAEEFKNEISLISNLQHRNLVRLLGYCIKGDEKLLIYEYLKYKSLDAWLFDAKRKEHLDWAKRFNIIEGVARGLLYLHRDSRLRIIHRDLKASNVLLDDNMDPKISDFGLARSFQVTQDLANTQRVVGTFGYISPEYAMGGIISEKSDVYSFGVLLLEIISGMRNTSFYYHEKYSLLGHAWKLREEGRGLELMDQGLADSCQAADFMQCMQIGLLCVQYHSTDRPTMPTVVLMLKRETHLPEPKTHVFYQDMVSWNLDSQSVANFSTSNISVGR